MKVGDKITMYFDGFGTTSEETCTITEITPTTCTTDTEFCNMDSQYNRKTGQLILRGKQENSFGCKRRIKPF